MMVVVEAPKRIKMTKEEFLKLAEGPPYVEFECGEVIELPSASSSHSTVLMLLSNAIHTHVRENKLGRVWIELDTWITEDKCYMPDIVYLSNEHLERLGEDDDIHGPPDLVVEILSPTSVRRDTITKATAYFQAGVPWYWLVDSDELTMEEYHAEGGCYQLKAFARAGEFFRPTLFAGLEINLKELVG